MNTKLEELTEAMMKAVGRLLLEDVEFVNLLVKQPEVQAVLAKHAPVASSPLR